MNPRSIGRFHAFLVGATIATSPAFARPAPPDPPPEVAPPPRPPLTAIDATDVTLVGSSRAGLPEIAVEIRGIWHRLELAATEPRRRRGMGGRSVIPRGTGMLFIHPDEAPRRYWMKDCLVDIDIAYLDRNGVVVAIHRMSAEPPRGDTERLAAYDARLPRYPSRRGARYALELAAGEMTRLDVRVGRGIGLPVRALESFHRRSGGQ